MNKCSRFLAGLLTAGLIFSLGTVSSKAAEQEGTYGYQVTFMREIRVLLQMQPAYRY